MVSNREETPNYYFLLSLLGFAVPLMFLVKLQAYIYS